MAAECAFVNPETKSYVYPDDQRFVPKLTSSECYTHVAYRRTPQAAPVQLICCSATLEFYEFLHQVRPEHVWRETDTFLTTITAIRTSAHLILRRTFLGQWTVKMIFSGCRRRALMCRSISG